MKKPVYFEIATLEQLEIMTCALEEFSDSNAETQWQAICLAERLRNEFARQQVKTGAA